MPTGGACGCVGGAHSSAPTCRQRLLCTRAWASCPSRVRGCSAMDRSRPRLLPLAWCAQAIMLGLLQRPAAAQRSSGDPVVAGDGGGLEDAQVCSKQPLTPLNLETLLTAGSILASNYEITSCSAANLVEDGVGPCLFDLGFEGYELEDPETDWQCSSELEPSSCFGLACDKYHKGTVEYGCVFSIFRSTNSETVAGPNEGPLLTGYFSVPVGCSYNTDWDPQYPCIGGMEWTAIGSACMRTCHYEPHADACSAAPVSRCECPEGKPIWDRLLGCTTTEGCAAEYGDLPELSVEDKFKPVAPAQPFPYGWAGEGKS